MNVLIHHDQPLEKWREGDGISLGAIRVTLPKLPLDFDGVCDCVYGTGELNQRPVPHELYDPSRVGGNRRINEFAPQSIQAGKRPSLVKSHEARVTDYVR